MQALGLWGEFLGAVQSLGAGFRVWLWGLRPFKGFWSRIERLRSRGFGSVLIGDFSVPAQPAECLVRSQALCQCEIVRVEATFERKASGTN